LQLRQQPLFALGVQGLSGRKGSVLLWHNCTPCTFLLVGIPGQVQIKVLRKVNQIILFRKTFLFDYFNTIFAPERKK
jgi:hypothetical protein